MPAAKKAKGPTAYFIFTEEKRPEVTARLKQEAADGKVAVTAVAKALGDLWKALSDAEKETYKDKAKERAEAAAAAAADDTADQQLEEGAAADDQPAAAAAAAALPFGSVKKLMLADDEVQRVSAEAVWLAGEAARVFLRLLATKSAAAAAAKKRKTIKLEDFEYVVRCDKRLVEAGLKDVVNNKQFFQLHGAAAAASSRKKAGVAAGNGDGGKAAQGGEAAAEGDAAEGAGQQQEDQEEEGLTEQQRIERENERVQQEEAQRKQAAEAAKARAAKATERKLAKAAEGAKNIHKITTFFASNKPDTFV